MSARGNMLRGRDGSVTAVIDGKTLEIGTIISLSATLETEVIEYKEINKRATQYEAAGWAGSGDIKLRYGLKEYMAIADYYNKHNQMPEIELIVVNEDPKYNEGSLKTQLTGVVFEKMTIAQVDIDADFLEDESSFKFTDFNRL